jgi:hypothetical protein
MTRCVLKVVSHDHGLTFVLQPLTMQLMSHNRILVFYRFTCELFEAPLFQHCESLDHPTHIGLAPVWTYELGGDDNGCPTIHRLLDAPTHSDGTVILSWNRDEHHCLITLPADASPPSVVQLPPLALSANLTDRMARFRGVVLHSDGHDLLLVTNDAENNTAYLAEVDFISELRPLVLDDESLRIARIDLDEGTGRICLVFWRQYKTGFNVVKLRAMTNFIVVLDFMAE